MDIPIKDLEDKFYTNQGVYILTKTLEKSKSFDFTDISQ